MINSKHNGLFVGWKINNKFLFKYLKSSEKFPEHVVGSSLTYHKILKTFVLNLNYEDTTKVSKNKETCAIDQGIKRPFTIYSQTTVTEIGDKSCDKLYKVCKEIDIIKSRIDKGKYYTKYKVNEVVYRKEHKVNANVRRNLRKAMHKKIQYVKNLRTELHNKTIKYLCDTYKAIILPPFKIQELAGKLNSKVSRNMFTLSFYKFKQKLKTKAKEMGVCVYELNEPFTSKTCGRCGYIKYNLGNADIYKCDKCGLVIGRDINGSRNILLRNLSQI